MFTLSDNRRVEWPVKVRVPEKGKTRIDTFTGIFELPDLEEAAERIGDGRDLKAVREFLRDVFVGWRQVTDENGQEMPFSDDVREQMLNRHNIVEAVAVAFREALEGGASKTEGRGAPLSAPRVSSGGRPWH